MCIVYFWIAYLTLQFNASFLLRVAVALNGHDHIRRSASRVAGAAGTTGTATVLP